MSNLLVGCDPEVFLIDKISGEFVSAHGLLPGNKRDPFEVVNGAVQVDGMACEFNTEPASNRGEFVQYVTDVYSQLSDMIPEGTSLSVGTPVATFTPEVFKAQPLVALEFGCDPDFNAYTGSANPRPDDHGEMIRTAAGHVHLGFTEVTDPSSPQHMEDCSDLVKILDAYLGVYSLKYDRDTVRRKLYGSAGAFRPKTYGLEYRVLSNSWLSSEELIGEIYDRSEYAVKLYQDGFRLPEGLAQYAQSIINSASFDEVEGFLEIFKEISNG